MRQRVVTDHADGRPMAPRVRPMAPTAARSSASAAAIIDERSTVRLRRRDDTSVGDHDTIAATDPAKSRFLKPSPSYISPSDWGKGLRYEGNDTLKKTWGAYGAYLDPGPPHIGYSLS